MSVKVKIKDFKSIGETEIEISGFTAILGRNNLGKSNLWRALYGLFHNKASAGFVRWGSGSSHSVVEVSFDDGTSIQWEKGEGNGINHYVVNGKRLENVGRGVPDEVRELGVGSVEIAGEMMTPQFARQARGEIFLLDKTGAVLAEAISDVDSVARINAALKLAEKDRKATLSKAKLREQDLKEAQEKLKEFKGLDPLVVTFGGFEKQRVLLVGAKSNLESLQELSREHKHAKSVCVSLQKVRGFSLPESEEASELSLKIISLRELETC